MPRADTLSHLALRYLGQNVERYAPTRPSTVKRGNDIRHTFGAPFFFPLGDSEYAYHCA